MQGLSQEECFGGPNESLREPPGGGLGDFPVGPVWAFLGEAGAGCGGYGSGAGEGGVLTPERAGIFFLLKYYYLFSRSSLFLQEQKLSYRDLLFRK